LNNPKGLRETLESCAPLINSFPSEIEHLVIDSSPDVHRDLRHQFPHAKWNESPADGIYQALNRGNRLSGGAFIWHLHSGDKLFSKQNLLAAIQRIESFPEAALIYSPILLLKEPPVWTNPLEEFRKTLLRFRIDHPGTLFRKAVIDRLGGFSEDFKLAGDYDLFVKIANLRVPTIFHPHGFTAFDVGGISSTNPRKALSEVRSSYYHLRKSPWERMLSEPRLYYGWIRHWFVEQFYARRAFKL